MYGVRMACIVMAAIMLATSAFPQGKQSPDDAYLYFVWPQDGAVIKGGFSCRFGLRNMGVTHAGDDFANFLLQKSDFMSFAQIHEVLPAQVQPGIASLKLL